jgi:glycosyltransferase involved in cell wall biosynthesis
VTYRVAVCIASRNRAARLHALLQALERQTESAFSVVVVDDGSTDETAKILDDARKTVRYDLTVLHNQAPSGPAAGRNRAWRAAQGDIVAFTDDDCRPAPEWMSGLLAAFEQGADVVVGAVRPDREVAGAAGVFDRTLTVTPRELRWYATANVSYRMSLLRQLGGFDEVFTHAAGEDTDLGWRAEQAHARVAFAPDAVVFHAVHRAGCLDAVRDQSRWADLALLMARHPEERGRVLRGGLFWRRSHAELLLLAAAVATGRRRPASLLLCLPWLHGKTCRDRPELELRERVAALPGLLAVDVAEVVAAARGSIRHRTLLL